MRAGTNSWRFRPSGGSSALGAAPTVNRCCIFSSAAFSDVSQSELNHNPTLSELSELSAPEQVVARQPAEAPQQPLDGDAAVAQASGKQ